MKIIIEPTVTLIAGTQFYGHPTYSIPADGDDATRTCAFAGKGCYDSFGADGRSNEANQRQIISMHHGSVLEHVSASLFIEGITRGCSLEMNRHRHFGISQRSTRYTAEEDAALVLEPMYARAYSAGPGAPGYGLAVGHVRSAAAAFDAYQHEVVSLLHIAPDGMSGTEQRKWARGKARNILPHGLETRGTWTTNLRGWRHFIEMRSERYAEPEIRRLAMHVFRVLSAWAPLYFEDYSPVEVDGFPEYQTAHRKI